MARLRIGFVLTLVILLTLPMMLVQIVALKTGWSLHRRLPRRWHKMVCFLLGIRIRVRGAPSPVRPLLLVANHASWLDIVVLGAVADVSFIAKSDMATWPIFGYLAKLQSTIFVEREDRRKTGKQVSEIATRLGQGDIIVLFPEGTTSDGNYVLTFKSSLLGAAATVAGNGDDTLVHVQPVTIGYVKIQGMPMGRYWRHVASWPGDVPLTPHLFGIARHGALDVEVRFGEPVDFTARSNRKHVTRELESRIRSDLQRILLARPD